MVAGVARYCPIAARTIATTKAQPQVGAIRSVSKASRGAAITLTTVERPFAFSATGAETLMRPPNTKACRPLILRGRFRFVSRRLWRRPVKAADVAFYYLTNVFETFAAELEKLQLQDDPRAPERPARIDVFYPGVAVRGQFGRTGTCAH